MIHENGFQFLDGTCNGSSTSTSSSVPCVKCCEGNGDFFRLENTQLAGYCPGCFARVVRQKFASCLGRNRVFKKPSQRNTLLLYLPDQLGSDQLLQFVQQTSSEPDVHRRLRIKATVLLLVEELCPQNFAAYFSHCRDLAQQFPSDWQWHFSHVAKIFNSGSDLAITLDCNGFDEQMILNWQGQDLSKLEQLLASCRSDSVRAELSRLLRNQLITRFALHSKCPTVLLPENADQLAENALNMLCFGRGSSISDLSAVVDTRLADDQAQEQNIGIQFVRPLRDISTRELEAMRRMDEKQQRPNVVNAAAAVHTVTDDGNGSDVQQLTGQFIASLRDSGFPATVSTILSVASKVESERSGIRCALCFAFFQLQSADTPSDAANGQTLPSFCPPLCQPCANLMQEISEHGRSLLAQICCDTLSCLTSS